MTGTSFQRLDGQRFGHLVAIRFMGTKHRQKQWLCRCDCGKEKEVSASNLRNGNTKSCGCLSRRNSAERMSTLNKKHGLTRTPEYLTWQSINDRCHNTNSQHYPNYGAKGIAVCRRWRRTKASWLPLFQFIKDMGQRPSKFHSIERIDNTKGYSPENCKWATRIEQANNTRRSVKITHEGVTLSVSQWARRVGLHEDCLRQRLYNGWSVQRALTTPSRGY